MRNLNRPNRHHERGATAILFAIFATLFFTVAALGVDLGNAMTRKRDVQTQADLAALAGGGELPTEGLTPTPVDDEVRAVAAYLIKNRVYDDTGSLTIPTFSATDTADERDAKIDALATKLVSTNPADVEKYGHVYYGSFDASGTFIPSKNMLTVLAPHRRISFGLARVAGFDHVDVSAHATAAIKSPGSVAAMPFYAYSGCDWGQQIISHSTTSSPPNVKYPKSTNIAAVDALIVDAEYPALHQVDENYADPLELVGSGFTSVTKVGLFPSDGTDEMPLTEGDAAGNFRIDDSEHITFWLPSTLPAGSYYVRVEAPKNTGNNADSAWSEVSNVFLNVGDATLFCSDDKSSGNFGSITVARSDSTKGASNGWLPLNIAKGLDLPNVGVTLYGTTNSDSCGNSDTTAVQSDDPSLRTDINCLKTDTGFPQNPATNGLITGVASSPTTPGRLDTDPVCPENAELPATREAAGVIINNDVLSCFFTDDDTSVAKVSSENYDGDVVIDASIFGSPRFFWIPVIPTQADSGKSSYPLIDFRAAFLTGENGDATRGHGVGPALNTYYWDDPVTNGLKMAKDSTNGQDQVDSFRVVFINPKALPPDSSGGSPIDYTGSGTKLLFLVD